VYTTRFTSTPRKLNNGGSCCASENFLIITKTIFFFHIPSSHGLALALGPTLEIHGDDDDESCKVSLLTFLSSRTRAPAHYYLSWRIAKWKIRINIMDFNFGYLKVLTIYSALELFSCLFSQSQSLSEILRMLHFIIVVPKPGPLVECLYILCIIKSMDWGLSWWENGKHHINMIILNKHLHTINMFFSLKYIAKQGVLQIAKYSFLELTIICTQWVCLVPYKNIYMDQNHSFSRSPSFFHRY